MPKKISLQEKELIKSAFIDGQSIPELSDKFNVSKVTISRYLKKEITEHKYKEILKKNKNMKKNNFLKKEINPISETYNVGFIGKEGYFFE